MAVLRRAAESDLSAGAGPVGPEEARKDLKIATFTHDQHSLSLGDAKHKRPTVIEFLEKKFQGLIEERSFNNSVFLGTTAGFNGILANIILRSSFKVQHESLKTYASVTALPFLSTIMTYELFVTNALHSGNISLENCVLRSSLVSMVCGVLYPAALAFSKNGRLAVKYHTVPLPPRGRVILYWVSLCQAQIKVMTFPLVFQTFFGIINGLNQYESFKSKAHKTVHKD
ncbi:complex I assembly factor TMEM126B, mitochondrial [Erinaceus europaeus]|uniref:Complex I assembly factor TMEM126B, mitochondrial n=1 Tax=Erinaceus europaeus TaxID=9365 RepID=A0ABM3W856_ERIEU|nr:complex I assembly factor TMEM126B, mitochondrial [Erinaceus europaeus]